MKSILALSAANANIAFANAGTPPAAKPEAITVTAAVDFLITPPARKGGAESKYPFDTLEIGKAFGVKGATKRGISSAISNANRKNRSELTNADGTTSKVQTKHFFAVDVDAARAKELKGTPLEGCTVLVSRSK